MDSDDITLEPQATFEYDSAVVETENHNEDAAQNTEILRYENFDWGLFPGFKLPHHTKIGRRVWIWTQIYEVEEIVTGIKYAVCKHCLKSRPTEASSDFRTTSKSIAVRSTP